MRYFINVSADEGTITDLVGVDLPDVEAARRHAISHRSELWETRILAGKPPLVGWLEVTDEHERGVLRIPL